MSLTGLLLMSNSELFTLAFSWFFGVALVVGLFLYNRARIKHSEDSHGV